MLPGPTGGLAAITADVPTATSASVVVPASKPVIRLREDELPGVPGETYLRKFITSPFLNGALRPGIAPLQDGRLRGKNPWRGLGIAWLFPVVTPVNWHQHSATPFRGNAPPARVPLQSPCSSKGHSVPN